MVFPVPVVEMVTLLPLIGLLLLSSNVMVTVIDKFPSATADVGEADIIDVAPDIGPEVKVTVVVLIRLMLSVVLVADIVFVSAFVDLIVAVA